VWTARSLLCHITNMPAAKRMSNDVTVIVEWDVRSVPVPVDLAFEITFVRIMPLGMVLVHQGKLLESGLLAPVDIDSQ